MTQKTRAVLAMEALKAAMPKDYEGNLGLNEAYRMGLEDMVNWIDIGIEPPFTNTVQGAPAEKDELFDEAVVAVKQKTGGHIQGRWLAALFGISYGRASALIDQLEAAGVISPKDGAKPRKVL